MIVLYNQISVFIVDILTGISPCDSVLQSFDGLLTVHKGSDHNAGNLVSSLGTVGLTDTQLLGYIHHSPGQVTGVRSTQRRIGQTLAGSVGRHEILQHVQSLTEIGLDRQLDGTACGIGHQSAHARQLFDLLVGTTGAGVGHHENIIVGVQACQKHLCQFLIRLIPGLHHCAVPLFLGNQASAEVGGNLVNSSLSLGQHLRLLFRHGHIRNRHCHGRPGGILISDGLYVIQHLCGSGCPVGIDDLFQNLLQAFFAHMEIHLQLQEVLRLLSFHKAQILGQNFVENKSSQG